VGDFDDPATHDRAVGNPGDGIGAAGGAGAVVILLGTSSGLDALGSYRLDQDSQDVEDSAEADDAFGSTLAAGDFDGDGHADLAVGVPEEDVGAIGDAGAVNVLYGSAFGLNGDRDQFWNQDSLDVPDRAEAGDNFGG
jgi:hypothetical protein